MPTSSENVFTSNLKIARPVMLAVKAKIYGVLYKKSSSIAFDETSLLVSAKQLLVSRLFIGHTVVCFPLVRISLPRG